MSEDEAAKAGLDDHRAHFQIGDIEGNLAPPSSDYARWYEKISVAAPNGESVGVIVPWQWPDAFDGINPQIADKVRKAVMAADPRPKENAQASSLVGHIVGPILGIDSTDKAGQARLKSIIRTWIKSDVLAVERLWSARDGRDVPFVVAGSNNPMDGSQ